MESAEIDRLEPAGGAARTLVESFQRISTVRPQAVALQSAGGSGQISWEAYRERVQSIAGGLAALGVSHGDPVGLMLTNRPEFNLCDTAALHLGATPFSIYNTSAPEQIAYLFSNARNNVVICEAQFVPKLREVWTGRYMICVDGEPDGTISLDAVEASTDPMFDFDATWRCVREDDVATLIYTSGTTGPPKGVELTHANLIYELAALATVLPFKFGDRLTSYLPSAHLADRITTHYPSLYFGVVLTCIDDPQQLTAALPEVRPTIWGGVPRVWEKIKAALEAGGVIDPAALPESRRAAIVQRLGLDEMRYAICGGAPIPVEVLEYFSALGLPIAEVWGMSETSAITTLNPPQRLKGGSVGPPLPGIELALADDGELLVRGPTVMRGYRGDPARTAEAIDPDGWLHTGDLGEIDADGYVKIIDRKKELIISAAGKNMSPANIEQTLKASSPLVGQAVCIGDRRPYNVALIVLDPLVCKAFARERNLPDDSVVALAESDEVNAAVDAAVAAANARLSRVEQIKRFKILATDWLPGCEELTPTMKLRRKPIAEKYAAEIEDLYASRTAATPSAL